MDDQLITYVRDSAARGVTAEVTRQQLTSVGWDTKMVDHAISSVYPSASLSDLSSTVTNSINQNRGKWFLILGIMVFFGISSVIIGAIIFVTSPSRSLSKVNNSLASSEQSSSSLATLPNSVYQTYVNDEYNFRLTIPTDWSYKEYSRSTYGEFRIAFATKKNLPNDYFGEGDFVWLRVFPTSAKEKYAKFIAESKKGGVKPIILSGTKAFDTGKMIGVENAENAFELYPPTESANNGNPVYTPNAKRIISSWRFVK
ncbi:MAG: hypothetical protein M3Q44_05695 [bacterium]|nr:hypothetical protein [bacterium]